MQFGGADAIVGALVQVLSAVGELVVPISEAQLLATAPAVLGVGVDHQQL